MTSLPWLNRGRGDGTTKPLRLRARSAAAQATEPRATTACNELRVSPTSRSSHAEHAVRSADVGALPRRRAPNRRHNPGTGQMETISGVRRLRLRCKSGLVQRREQPVAATVTCEDSAGPVATMGGRRQADDEQPRRHIAEAGNRTPPVRLVSERPSLGTSDFLAPGDQSRTCPAHRRPSRELRNIGFSSERSDSGASVATDVASVAMSPGQPVPGETGLRYLLPVAGCANWLPTVHC